MFCSECGTRLPDGALFCSECGTRQMVPQFNEVAQSAVSIAEPVKSLQEEEKVLDVPMEEEAESSGEIKKEPIDTKSEANCVEEKKNEDVQYIKELEGKIAVLELKIGDIQIVLEKYRKIVDGISDVFSK